VLEGFFARKQRFFLTGGAALVGFYLGHRTTEDLDLFATAELLDAGEAALRSTAAELGATMEDVRTFPGFRRKLLRRGDEGVIVDLVFDQAPQIHAEKPRIGSVRIDPIDEILANKLCTLIERAQVRDLVDALFLERAGLRIEEALPQGNRKDGGLTPAQLGWVLSQVQVGDDARIPAGLAPAELRSFLADLRRGCRGWPFRDRDDPGALRSTLLVDVPADDRVRAVNIFRLPRALEPGGLAHPDRADHVADGVRRAIESDADAHPRIVVASRSYILRRHGFHAPHLLSRPAQ
jgi:hypothetical protein